MQPVFQMHADIVRGLTNYYYTFIDVMDFKVNVFKSLLIQILRLTKAKLAQNLNFTIIADNKQVT